MKHKFKIVIECNPDVSPKILREKLHNLIGYSANFEPFREFFQPEELKVTYLPPAPTKLKVRRANVVNNTYKDKKE